MRLAAPLTSGRFRVRYGPCITVAAVLLSLAPAGVKAALHTRGLLHAWCHAALFAVLSLSFLRGRSGMSRVLQYSCCLLLFGLSLEFVQAHGTLAYVEWADVLSDAGGLAAAGMSTCVLTRAPSLWRAARLRWTQMQVAEGVRLERAAAHTWSVGQVF